MALCHVIISRRTCSYIDKAAFQQRFNVNIFGTLSARFRCEAFVVTLKEDATHDPSNNTYTYDYEVALEHGDTEASQQNLQLILAEARHLCGISKRRFVSTT